ncbi:UAA transporter family protein [Acinetobacter sp. 8I-beige]|nr:UAA transporter family protein [Acinetobacter sp. 8I-beige]
MSFNHFLGLFYVGMCYFLVGSSYPIAQNAMSNIPTWSFMFITFLIATLFLLPFSIYMDKTNWLKIGLKSWRDLSILSLLGAVLYTYFLLYGMEGTSAVTASVITSSAPILVLILSIFFLKERSSTHKIISILLAISSILVMTLPDQMNEGKGSSFIGLILISLSTLSNALNIIYSKKISSNLQPLTLATGVCFMGCLFSFPLSFNEVDHIKVGLLYENILIFLYYGVLVWAIPYMLFFKGINFISASSAGMCVALIPFSAMISSIFIFDYSLKTTDFFAIFLIILSIIVSEFKYSRKNKSCKASIQTPTQP